MVLKQRIVLASNSPRRQQLLTDLGLEFEVAPSKINELDYAMSSGKALAAILSVAKAQDVAEDFPLSIVIGCDTVVEVDGMLLGKPQNESEARKMLEMLSGKTHTVYTGIAIACRGQVKNEVVITKVNFKELSSEEIDRYIASGEPFDKAGAYAIQGKGSTLVSSIEGDYFAVVGLPVFTLARMLEQHFDFHVL
ncbi:MAG: septum formation inhibitor Maf [Clostridia bacterium]|nr:septum formation inhibitor Maf [Clostridia bacterium]